ncbi:hypothetical protein NOV72_00128 [Caballeronia novacaledonica]|uniref:Uncharacterized protein n=1 Tax=Caballeronia novacaledonica TaxID=1544861 RepID=A0A2U3HYF7_9BURK|nr:hypothetical protein NOV72_00128 [Caballeronia novacaledonica]
MESCFRVGLFVLPLCGAAVTFFAAANSGFEIAFVGDGDSRHRRLLLLRNPVFASVYSCCPCAGRQSLSLPLQIVASRLLSSGTAIRVIGVCFFYGILFSRRSICVAPVRGGSHFLCCCKESNQRNSFPHPKCFTPAAAQAIDLMAPRVASALTKLTRLGPRTVRRASSLNTWVQQSYIRHSATRCRRACKGNQRRRNDAR